MADKVYSYISSGVTVAGLSSLLPATVTSLTNVGASRLYVTVDETAQADLDDVLGALGYIAEGEITSGIVPTSPRDYGILASPPTEPAPSQGDSFYSSAEDERFWYNGTYWLGSPYAIMTNRNDATVNNNNRLNFGNTTNGNTNGGWPMDGEVYIVSARWTVRTGGLVSGNFQLRQADGAGGVTLLWTSADITTTTNATTLRGEEAVGVLLAADHPIHMRWSSGNTTIRPVIVLKARKRIT